MTSFSYRLFSVLLFFFLLVFLSKTSQAIQIQTPPCLLAVNHKNKIPKSSFKQLQVCLAASSKADITRSFTNNDYTRNFYNNGRISLIQSSHSLFFSGFIFSSQFESTTTSSLFKSLKRVDELIYQFKSSRRSPYKWRIGRRRLPFALNLIFIDGFYTPYEAFDIRGLPVWSTSLQWSNHHNKVFEIASGFSKNMIDDFQQEVRSYSFRFHFDLPAINRARLSMSSYWNSRKIFKVSFSILNISSDNSTNQFEWIVSRQKKLGIPKQQVFYRLAHKSALRGKTRTIFQWDYLSAKHRNIIVLREHHFEKNFFFQFGLINSKNLVHKNKHRWKFVLGARYTL